MNRIKEIRQAAGLTQEELAERVGTTGNTIWRLESGRSPLTQDWMTRLAEALSCTPADLIANVVAAEVSTEVESVEDHPVFSVIKQRGYRVYRVTPTARSVINAGIAPGDIITVDESDHAVSTLTGLEIVLVELGKDRAKALRQFVPPTLLVTNRGGANLAINLDDPVVNPSIVGVVLREPTKAS